MQMDIDEPICVIDVDIILVNDYNKLFDYPVKRGQFLAIPGWWRDSTKNNYKIINHKPAWFNTTKSINGMTFNLDKKSLPPFE